MTGEMICIRVSVLKSYRKGARYGNVARAFGLY